MGKKKRSGGLMGSDYGAIFFGLLGPIVCMGAGMMMPMRFAKPAMELSWPNRWYYILRATDMGTSPSAMYKMLKLEICMRFDQAQATFGNPTGMLMGKFMSDGPLSSITSLAPICDVKAACREHLSTRCIWYEYMYFDGMCFFGANMMAFAQMGLCVIVIFILRKREYRWYAMMISISATGMSGGALCYWIMDSHYYLKDMATQTIWPYAPFNGSGSKLCMGGIFFQMVAVCCNFLSSRPEAEVVDGPPGMPPGMPMGGMPPPSA